MSSMPTFLERNRAFADGEYEPLPAAPRYSAMIVSCLDARTDPAHFLGLAPGDTLVLRNLGGRVTANVERQIGLLAAFATKMGLDSPEVIVVHHTRCGMQKLADPRLRKAVADAAQVPEEEVAPLAISDHDVSLRTDIDRLHRSPHLHAGTPVKGVLLDLETGRASVRIEETLR